VSIVGRTNNACCLVGVVSTAAVCWCVWQVDTMLGTVWTSLTLRLTKKQLLIDWLTFTHQPWDQLNSTGNVAVSVACLKCVLLWEIGNWHFNENYCKILPTRHSS